MSAVLRQLSAQSGLNTKTVPCPAVTQSLGAEIKNSGVFLLGQPSNNMPAALAMTAVLAL